MKNKPDGLDGAKVRKGIKEARREITEWRSDGTSAREIAVKVYEDLYLKRATKADAAQVLAEVLRRKPPEPEQLRELLPDYIIDAIDYVTGNEDSGEKFDAVGN